MKPQIWDVPAYLPYVQPPLKAALVSEVEQEIGHRLPKEYLDLLKIQNDGYIRLQLPGMVHDVIYGIGPRFPHLTKPDWSEVQEWVEFPLDGLVPFDGDGHWHLCFDYRKKAESPEITYVDVESGSQEPIAESFAAYLEKLELEVDAETFVVAFDSSIEDLVVRLETILDIKFEAPSSHDYGYQVHRATIGANKTGKRKGYPEWVAVSPNLVPKGFIREDDPDFKTLKDSFPGMANRYPELSAQSCLIDLTEGIASSFTEKIRKAGLEIQTLKEDLEK